MMMFTSNYDGVNLGEFKYEIYACRFFSGIRLNHSLPVNSETCLSKNYQIIAGDDLMMIGWALKAFSRYALYK